MALNKLVVFGGFNGEYLADVHTVKLPGLARARRPVRGRRRGSSVSSAASSGTGSGEAGAGAGVAGGKDAILGNVSFHDATPSAPPAAWDTFAVPPGFPEEAVPATTTTTAASAAAAPSLPSTAPRSPSSPSSPLSGLHLHQQPFRGGALSLGRGRLHTASPMSAALSSAARLPAHLSPANYSPAASRCDSPASYGSADSRLNTAGGRLTAVDAGHSPPTGLASSPALGSSPLASSAAAAAARLQRRTQTGAVGSPLRAMAPAPLPSVAPPPPATGTVGRAGAPASPLRAELAALGANVRVDNDLVEQAEAMGFKRDDLVAGVLALAAAGHDVADPNLLLDHLMLRGAAGGGARSAPSAAAAAPVAATEDRGTSDSPSPVLLDLAVDGGGGAAGGEDPRPVSPPAPTTLPTSAASAPTAEAALRQQVAQLKALLVAKEREVQGLSRTVAELRGKGCCRVCGGDDAAADVALQPCGHLCVCHSCVLELVSAGHSRCPICRQQFSTYARVYPC